MLYYFSDFVLDTGRREMRRGENQIPLEPQVFDLLEFLIRARDRVVSRDELLDTIWRGRTVSDATLSSRVNAARTAVGDNGSAIPDIAVSSNGSAAASSLPSAASL